MFETPEAVLDFLAEQWEHEKAAEAKHALRRREIEDVIAGIVGADETQPGTTKVEAGSRRVKITASLRHKVDGDKLQDVAKEHGMNEHLRTLFRWKPEINAAAWKAAAPSITDVLAQGITSTPARLSFKIETKE